MTTSHSNATMSNCEFLKLVPRLGHATSQLGKELCRSYTAYSLLNLFLELTVVIAAFEGPFAVTVSSNQHYDHQQGDRLEHPLNRTIRGYVKVSIEATLIVVS